MRLLLVALSSWSQGRSLCNSGAPRTGRQEHQACEARTPGLPVLDSDLPDLASNHLVDVLP